MRKSNKNADKDTATRIEDSTDVVSTNSKSSFLITILPVLSMIAAILPGILNRKPAPEIAKLGILTLVLTGAATFYIRLNADSILNKRLAKTLITFGYLLSIGLLLLIPAPETFSFWMIGGLLIAMLIDSKLGLLLHFNLSFILGISFSLRPEIVIQILILGVVMSLLSSSLKDKSTVIYAAIIILSTNITLAFAVNNFIFETKSNFNYLNSLFSIFAVLIIAFFLATIYSIKGDRILAKELSQDNSNNPLIIDEKRITTNDILNITVTPQEEVAASIVAIEQSAEVIENEESSKLPHIIGSRTNYDVLCDFDNELIVKMKQFSETLYSHCVNIGDLSYRAAVEIGANELLALAGGLYHEIGKIKGKNYIEEGLIIAEDYAFPKELKAILKEHNIKYEKPSSVEAAIVMLSDNVVSTIEYIKKTEDHKFTTNKIIDNIFQMRMDKGTFDASSLSIKDFKKLKEFFQKEYNQ